MHSVWAEDFGLDASNLPLVNSDAIRDAVESLRGAPVTLSSDGLGGGSVTVYPSGELRIGAGVFAIAPDVLKFTQDLGLIIRGQGSRRTNNAVIGRTVLLITGTSSGFGLQVQGDGARGLTLEDLDLVYADSGFTGDCLDNFGAPGMTLNRVHIGTHGITGGTRLQSARSCVRSTYDEFMHFIDCAFDGAVDGWWSDDTRCSPHQGVPCNEFGGSQTSFQSSVFYDFTGAMIRHAGNRNRKGLTLDKVSFNPISVNCTRAVDASNIDGLLLQGGIFTASTDYHASVEWLRLNNDTGRVDGCWFGNFSPIGTIGGNLSITNNFFGGTDGITLKSGCITAHGNEFSIGLTGWIASPSHNLTFRLGPDSFRGGVGRSYDIAAESAYLDGHIVYSAMQDETANKFRNASVRVSIRDADGKALVVQSAQYDVRPEDTGRTIVADGSANQTFDLPSVGTPGLKYRFARNNASHALTIAAPTNLTLFVGGGAAKTSVTAPAGDVGALLMVESLGTAGWNLTERVGSFTFA